MTLRKALADAVQRATSRAVTQEGAGWCLASVTAVYADGTVDINTGRGPIQKVRRLRAYSPVVGDVVKADFNADGNWLIAGALAP
ncbi:hypothetical protein [Streptomyces chryseus]|uniref:hypothetical protein n=1 Tax=Streptomyces chryseus TaxID=68186 RepID=UPI0019AFB4CF|nr:hypothetical protein [Streptomyces chryseus]GGX26918.1 hypothetical protein GCM10010353_47630 [Streptomyces chryseus]